MNNYQVLEFIGEGRYGRVKRAIHSETNTVVAIKKARRPPSVVRTLLALAHCHQRGIRMPVWRLPSGLTPEIAAMQKLHPHDHILRLYEHWEKEDGSVVHMACEYAPYDVQQVVCKELPENCIAYIIRDLLKGLAHCHENGIIHRDMKPSNIMITADGIIKLADFGQASLSQEGTLTREVGTRWYVAPELLYGSEHYDEKLDIWAVGCILAELLNGKELFRSESDIEQLSKIFRVLGTASERVWPDVVKLPDYDKIQFVETEPMSFRQICPKSSESACAFLAKFLKLDPKLRVSASEALNDPFLADCCTSGDMVKWVR